MSRVFQPAEKVIEIAVQGTYIGQLVENKFYAQTVEAVTDVMVAELASIADNWVSTTLLPLLPTAYTYLRSVARDLTVEASFESINATHGGDVGSNPGGGVPGNATFAVHRDTRLSGKKAKSRLYWPALVATQFAGDADTITSAVANQFVDAYDSLMAAIQAGTEATYTYGYLQRILLGVKLPAANFIQVFGHSFTDLFVDSMRRRLKGRGV